MPWGTFPFHQTSTEKNFNIPITAGKTCTNGTTITFVQVVVLTVLHVFYIKAGQTGQKVLFSKSQALLPQMWDVQSGDNGCRHESPGLLRNVGFGSILNPFSLTPLVVPLATRLPIAHSAMPVVSSDLPQAPAGLS